MTIKYHQETDSPFYRLRTKSKLSKLLFSSRSKIINLANGTDYYYTFSMAKKTDGYRQISAPRDDLKEVQSRIARLLQRIEPPEFLMAPVSGRSYVDNAARHLNANEVRLLDLEDFFPSCTANRVIWLFKKRMQCSPDVASILKALVTREGCLPQGSPCSPILAYFCYVDMWEEIDAIVRINHCRLSVYADDVTISGKTVSGSMIWKIKTIFHRFGHRYNVDKERCRRNKPVEITGVVVNGGTLLLPNRQHKKLRDVYSDLQTVRSATKRKSLENQLKGRKAQARQIQNHGS